MSARAVLLLAGEASGDVYAGALAAEIRARRPDLRLLGTGGERMREAGVELLATLDELAVMGLVEILSRLSFLRRLERRLDALLAHGDVALAVPVDYPGFNLRVAGRAKRRGVPVLYYVAPKVWAWGPRRARALAARTDGVAAILPFEVGFLAARGVRATFVGHPLLDAPSSDVGRASWCARWGLDPARPVLALLPGSRRQEIARHLDLFGRAAGHVVEARPDAQPVLGRARGLPPGALEGAGLPVVDDARTLLRHARVALVKSGTVTLEAALEGTPSVVAYRTSGLTWAIARRMLRVDHVSLPNLVAGRQVVPELLQEAATPDTLAAALLQLFDEESPERCRQLEGLGRVRAALGTPGATRRVAAMAIDLLDEGA